jgi:redox-sensitive bicupin YhaK (pirin superfamily)
LRAGGAPLAGLQVWVALPKAHEETEPSFAHHSAAELPLVDADGARLRVIVGDAFGERSPVPVFSETFYVDAEMKPGARVQLPTRHAERAAYVVDGELQVGDVSFGAGQLLVFAAARDVVPRAGESGARAVLFGGDAMDGPRHVWWNFVSSSKERIEQAKADWIAGRFDAVPGETEFIPLPGREPPPPVQYP